MRYLSGARNPVMLDDLATGRIGLLQTPRTRYRLEGVAVWAMDNGCFTDTYPGDDEYIATLSKYDEHKDRCLFVAVPDVVGDAGATLGNWPRMAPRIKAAGWPVALVLQDGMTPDSIPWAEVDWVFVGGSDDFKLGPDAERLILEAKKRDIKVHVGRVNSHKRYRKFAALGCDSADGTFIAFAPMKNHKSVLRWLDSHVEMRMF